MTIIIRDNATSEVLLFAQNELQAALCGYSGAESIELLSSPAKRNPCVSGPQSYCIYRDGNNIVVAGADEAGALYGALDLAEHFRQHKTLDNISAEVKKPFIGKRGIKLNIPLDARTPSYTDCGDSARQNIESMWDMDFWQGYLDRMARNKLNVLSLWSLSPFPSLVCTPGYEDLALDDVMIAPSQTRGSLRGTGFFRPDQQEELICVKRMSIDDKIEFWREVMRYAQSRCIQIYLFTWNVYVYGTEGNRYGITDEPQNPATVDYIRRSVEALVRTYPLLAGIGVTAGENMRREWAVNRSEDVMWSMSTYGRGVMDGLSDAPERDFSLIHRAHMTGVAQLEVAFSDFTQPFQLSFKYSQAHVYSTTKPNFGDDFFCQLNSGRKTWLTVRNDDFYLLPWGNPGFVREYLSGMPHDVLEGFYLGSDGIVWARDFTSRDSARFGKYRFDNHWYELAIWGRLAYDITLDDEYFQGLMMQRFGRDGEALFKAFSLASTAIPLLQQVYWHDYDFQWYPEACCGHLEEEDRLVFRDLRSFMQNRACPGAGYLSVREYCSAVASNERLTGISPLKVAAEMRDNCNAALELLKGVEVENAVCADIMSMARLGLYYAAKLNAAISCGVYRLLNNESGRLEAVCFAKEALSHWLEYSSDIAARYKPQRLSRLRNTISPDLFDDHARLDVVIAGECVFEAKRI